MINKNSLAFKQYTQLTDVYIKNLQMLDESQQAAVYAPEDKVAISAPAGSGKTATLAVAIANYRYENVNDRIYAVTFTNAAVQELQARLAEMGVKDVDISTIHSWCYRRILTLAQKYEFTPIILYEDDVKQILSYICKDYERTHKYKNINISIVYNYVMGNLKQSAIAYDERYRMMLGRLNDRYILYKNQNHLYDLTDFPRYLRDLLDQYHETINDVDALFVDEFQDSDPCQIEIFNRIINYRKKFYIGDTWQAIYGFRGASSEAFTKIERGFRFYKLRYNYRSYQEIINYAVGFYKNAPIFDENHKNRRQLYSITQRFNYLPTYKNPVACVRGAGGLVINVDGYGDIAWQGSHDEAAKLNGCLEKDYQDLVHSFLEVYQPMILCRTNKQKNAIIDNLSYTNVSTIHGAKGLEYDDVLVIDFPISDEESKNIAYVAITRAKNHLLTISWSLFTSAFNKVFF